MRSVPPLYRHCACTRFDFAASEDNAIPKPTRSRSVITISEDFQKNILDTAMFRTTIRPISESGAGAEAKTWRSKAVQMMEA